MIAVPTIVSYDLVSSSEIGHVSGLPFTLLCPLSLDAPLTGYDEPYTLGETLPDVHAPDPAQIVCEQEREQEMRGAVRTLLLSLTSREREIITAAFGLDGQGERSLYALACELGLHRSRVYQLYHSAMWKLRCASSVAKIDGSILEHSA